MKFLDEEKIITLLNESNHLAFEHLYNTYSNGLYNLAIMYLKSPVLSEDALQYVFMKLWENRQFINPKQNIRNFLYTVLKNHVLNILKSNHNDVEKYMEAMREAVDSVSDTPQEKIQLEQRIGKLYESISTLPLQKKRICELKLVGMTNEAISDEMGISVNTVKSHYRTALISLREYMKK